MNTFFGQMASGEFKYIIHLYLFDASAPRVHQEHRSRFFFFVVSAHLFSFIVSLACDKIREKTMQRIFELVK